MAHRVSQECGNSDETLPSSSFQAFRPVLRATLLLSSFVAYDTGDQKKSCFYEQGLKQNKQELSKSWLIPFDSSNELRSSDLGEFTLNFLRVTLQNLNSGLCNDKSTLTSIQVARMADNIESIFKRATVKPEDYKILSPYLQVFPEIFETLIDDEPQRTVTFVDKLLLLLESSNGLGLGSQAILFKVAWLQAQGDAYVALNQYSKAARTYQAALQELESSSFNFQDEDKIYSMAIEVLGEPSRFFSYPGKYGSLAEQQKFKDGLRVDLLKSLGKAY